MPAVVMTTVNTGSQRAMSRSGEAEAEPDEKAREEHGCARKADPGGSLTANHFQACPYG